MEEKKLTPQESMAVITQMIEATKQRRSMPDLRISIMWAALTIACAAIVLISALTHYTPWINLVWFAIPAVGLPVNIVMAKRSGCEKGVKTAIDTISDGIWKTYSYRYYASFSICSDIPKHGLPCFISRL